MHKFLFYILLAAFFISCNEPEKTINNADPLEAGREFIDASLKGDYDYAKQYLLADSTNEMYFERFVEFDNNKPAADKEGFKNANIIIDSTQTLSDSVTIINYSNTYKRKPSKIKLVKKNNKWQVDFKYTFVEM